MTRLFFIASASPSNELVQHNVLNHLFNMIAITYSPANEIAKER